MPSTAYLACRAERQRRIHHLFDLHSALHASSSGRFRRRHGEQVNWALVIRLAAELQGFAMDLHRAAAREVVQALAGSHPRLAWVFENSLVQGRMLDRGNPGRRSLEVDFGRFDMLLWDALEVGRGQAKTWSKDLEALLEARNAIAQASYELAAAMDDAVGHCVAELLGVLVHGEKTGAGDHGLRPGPRP